MSVKKRPRIHPKKHARNPDFAVQQNFASEADINTVINRHMKGPGRMGMPIGNPNATRQGRFVDLSSESFHDMLNRVTDAQTAFMNLPARIRGRFSNNPYQLLRFLEKPENREEAVRLGLIEPSDEPQPEKGSQGPLDPENEDPEDGQKPDPEANPRHSKKGGQQGSKSPKNNTTP